MEHKYQLPAKFSNKIERKTFWAKIFADQAASGLSAKRFCRLHQLPYSTYKGNKYQAKPKADKAAAKFLALELVVPNKTLDTVIADNLASAANTHQTTMTAEIQIIFNNNHRIVLPLATADAQLLVIIKTVAGLLC